MKKIRLSSVALLGLTAAASAADLPRRAAPPMFAPAIPVFTWTGFYVGVNAGYAWANNNNGDEAVSAAAATMTASPSAARPASTGRRARSFSALKATSTGPTSAAATTTASSAAMS
jgi:outer membrane immunogenic protein